MTSQHFRNSVFSFSWKYFLNSFEIPSLILMLFGSVFFTLQIFWYFMLLKQHSIIEFNFICYSIVVWEHNLCNLFTKICLGVFYWSIMWSILVNIPCELEKSVYSSAVGWSSLYISIRSSSLQLSYSLDNFEFDGSIDWLKMGIKVPATMVYLSISLCSTITVYLTYLDALFLGARMLLIVMSSRRIDSFIIMECNTLS